jgi:3-hydroxybutyryl-CoA dehydratase
MENNKLKVGDKFSLEFSYTQDQVVLFAQATGDDNPIHLDPAIASKTVFKKPILHGFLGGSVFSKIFGTLFPGQGTVYLKQSLTFLKPMYAEERYNAIVTIDEINPDKHRACVITKVINFNNEEVVTGDALISNLDKI